MNAGLFRNKIVIQSFSEKKDELGQILKEWTNTYNLWVMIRTIQGTEYIEASATQNQDTTRFVIRFMKNIEPTMRIVYKNKIYNIISVINDDEADKTLTIIAKSGDS
ncbi:phage head closure protein [Schinkia azotoformans]|uniref:Phage head-tail adaptor n=1 Tax=Schinkia azotoformans LMG 9581 TaxID=1131731 RepID=K6DIF5_SCHAZ|nr:phage head closure protein [Schinkia azotoformans]EKN68069.1 phage head-tail adaptor [Schinkia azotoformans LMG 9581]MEC1638125.1 phage head closure protein [Schinkia azotoformans]MEC1946441.1 phage head closure protein [Schinkia azotoformans]